MYVIDETLQFHKRMGALLRGNDALDGQYHVLPSIGPVFHGMLLVRRNAPFW